jgi:antitoxin (DNA-binding transcriptional repressor) of toxin-antitoxin stability system
VRLGDLPTLTTAAARRGFAGLLTRVAYHNERVVLTRFGYSVAAVVPIGDLRRLLELEAQCARTAQQGGRPSVGHAVAARLEAELGL